VGIPLKAEAASSDFSSSDKLVEVLKKMEGFSKKPYWDVSQYTVGYGTRCPDDKLEQYKKEGITKAEAEALLKKDLASREKAINNFIDKYELKLKQHQFDALVSFTYNCGTKWMNEDDGMFNNAVRSGDVGNDLLYAMVMWCSAGGEYILIDRRMCEANMYINGKYEAFNSGAEELYPDNFRYVFLDGNGGEVLYKVHAFNSDIPQTVRAEITKYPTGIDKDGNEVKYELAGWYTEDGQLVEQLDKTVASEQVLYAKWKDAEGNIVDVPKGKKPPTDMIIITGSEVNIRSGPGTYYKKVGKVYEDDVLTITEIYEGTDHTWAKTPKGWVSLTYAEMITADMKVRIKTQPKSASAIEGEKVTISLKASGDGLKYQWYYKSGSSFKACSGTGKSTYSITMTQERAGREMYCVVSDKYGNKIQSATVTLGMKIHISKQPVSTSASVGKSAKFSFSATGAGLTYQWYYSYNGQFLPSSDVGKTSYSITMTQERAGRQMYCLLTDKFGNSVKTNTVTMHLGATITQQPVSVQVKNGEQATIGLTAIGDGLKYQWYYKWKGEYLKSTDVGQPTYSITMTNDRAGRDMYCVVTDKYGTSVKSNVVTLGQAVSISKQPQSVTVADGEKATISLSATGEGLKYRWFYSYNGKFLESSDTGKSSYSITMTQDRAGREMYCIITDKYGNSVQTDTVTLGMKLAITKQPVSTSASLGKSAKFSFTATGAGLTYQWYYSYNGQFLPSSDVGKNSYSITMTQERAGRQMYCVITDKFGNTVKTDTVTMHLGASITQQPVSVQVKNGEKATIGLTAIGEDLKYQWYYKYDGKYLKSTDVGQPTYSITMTNARAGRDMYCIITDKYGTSVKSDVVTLGMMVSISKQPQSVTVADGAKATISLSATGEGLKYRWFYSYKGKFLESSDAGKASYSITMTQDRANRQMYCVITDKYGNTVQTDTVTLAMKFGITKQPTSASAYSGKKVTISLKATGEGLTYQWYYSYKGKFLASSDAGKASYSITMNKDRAGRQMYCVITDKYGNQIKSNTVTLKMK
ncbi:MAG: glycoside hydrolase family protein, partial [Oscillospiraceae bacterium]|nr:glycoside hydrolase family protein [Oscillospiraceae bacterium]